MGVAEEFDAWAADGRDKGMEEHHWHTAKHVLRRMPVEQGERILDLGTGSGYALRALRDTKQVGAGYGLDGSPRMLASAAGYTDDSAIGFVLGEFGSLPFLPDTIDHVFSMEAFYYASDPHRTLQEVRRVLRPGGTFYCAVNFFEESRHTHHWQDSISVEMTLWDRSTYRRAFRDAGLVVAEQDLIPDREIEIPPADAFPTDSYAQREDMIDRYRRWGTLLTVGVA